MKTTHVALATLLSLLAACTHSGGDPPQTSNQEHAISAELFSRGSKVLSISSEVIDSASGKRVIVTLHLDKPWPTENAIPVLEVRGKLYAAEGYDAQKPMFSVDYGALSVSAPIRLGWTGDMRHAGELVEIPLKVTPEGAVMAR